MTAEQIDNEMEVTFKNALNTWADQGMLSAERSDRLSSIVHTLGHKENRKPFYKTLPVSLVATAVVVLILVGLVPYTRSWAVDQLSMVSSYINKWSKTEKGWKWADTHQMFQEVLAVSKDKGYVFRVHRILADPTQTTIIYSVEGTHPADIELDSQKTVFEGKKFIDGYGGRTEIIDGVLVGSIETNPLPEESGTLELAVRRIGTTEGTWDVSFEVDRKPLGKITRTITVSKNIEVPGGSLTIEELVIAPTQTSVKLYYKGSGVGPDLDSGTVVKVFRKGSGPGPELTRRGKFGVSLSTPEGPVEPRGGRGNGSRTADGEWEQEYKFDFQRLDPVPPYVTFEFSGRIYRQGETRVQLKKGNTVFTPAGQEITVDRINSKGNQGEIVLRSYTVKAPWSVDLPEWQVQDNEGELHRTRPLNVSSTSVSAKENTGVTTQELEWELPPGHTAVGLVNPGYWEYKDNLGKIQINIPQK